MEELDISLDDQQETINSHAESAEERWLLWCALLSALLAVAAAVSGLYSSHYANEAMLEQMQASDLWGYYQAKGVKAIVTELRGDILVSNGKPVPAEIPKNLEKYREQQKETQKQADEKTHRSALLMERHEALSRGVTAFQIAIAVTAMAAICRRKHFLLLTLALALAGSWFCISSLFAG
jgi:hypothetical protein